MLPQSVPGEAAVKASMQQGEQGQQVRSSLVASAFLWVYSKSLSSWWPYPSTCHAGGLKGGFIGVGDKTVAHTSADIP